MQNGVVNLENLAHTRVMTKTMQRLSNPQYVHVGVGNYVVGTIEIPGLNGLKAHVEGIVTLSNDETMTKVEIAYRPQGAGARPTERTFLWVNKTDLSEIDGHPIEWEENDLPHDDESVIAAG